MQNLPRVTIGMPTLNGAKTIQASVESILNQSYKNFHLYISVNKSNDETFIKLSNLYGSHSKITIVESPVFLEASQNFFKVLSMCKDEFFMWASDDDYWDPNFIQCGMRALENKCDYFFPNFITGDLSTTKSKKGSKVSFLFLEGEDPTSRMLNFINLHHLSHKCNIVYSLFRTEFIRAQWDKQDISDDGALGALISFYGRGSISSEVLFLKHFTKDRSFLRVCKEMLIGLIPTRNALFKLQLKRSYDKICDFFPDQSQTIQKIARKYPRYTIKKDFRIIKNLTKQ